MHDREVSIILVNYRNPHLTVDCIRSIREQVHSTPYEIIVVDNASGDNSVAILQATEYIHVIPLEENIGFGSANNRGVAVAKGKYVFFLNNDTILENDPLESMTTYMESHPETGAVGGYLVNRERENSLSGGDLYTISKYLYIAVRKYLHLPAHIEIPEYRDELEVGYVIGADMLMRREEFLQTGGFDEKIFMYFEDVELCQRLHNQGKKAVLLQAPKIVHLEGKSGSTMFQKTHNTASMMYCIRKKYGAVRFRLFQFAYFLLKCPILLQGGTREWEYVASIYKYKNYLRK